MPQLHLLRSIAVAAIVAVGVGACHAVPRMTPDPSVTSLVVRNSSAFDTRVFALPTEGGAPVWLGTVPPASTRSLALTAAALRNKELLVLQTSAVGSAKSCTTRPISVDDETIAILDVRPNPTGDCSASTLQAVAAAEYFAAIR